MAIRPGREEIMEFDNLITLIKAVSDSKLTQFEMKDGEFKISMGKEKETVIATADSTVTIPAAVPAAVPAAGIPAAGIPAGSEEQKADMAGQVVKAPLVGTFYSASAPDAAPFVQVGDTVAEGQTLGIIEAMKLMNEIESDYAGTVKEILVENGQMVEYGQPLFVIG